MPASPVPDAVALELDRLVRRWQQLPLDRVQSVLPGTEQTYAERVHALVQHLADALTPRSRHSPADLGTLREISGLPAREVPRSAGESRDPRAGGAGRQEVVPDLGPGTVMDQLRVLVYDVCAADALPAARLTEELATLRRELP